MQELKDIEDRRGVKSKRQNGFGDDDGDDTEGFKGVRKRMNTDRDAGGFKGARGRGGGGRGAKRKKF